MRLIAHKYVRQLSLLLIADTIMFSLTDAQAVPSYILIIGFLLLAATIYQIVKGLIGFTKYYGLSIKRKQRLSLTVTVVIAGIIALNSMGQFNTKDILVMLPLVLIGYLYSLYAQAARRSSSV